MNDFGEKFSREKPTLTITYHKFAYTLGEHYNSTMNKSILKKWIERERLLKGEILTKIYLFYWYNKAEINFW